MIFTFQSLASPALESGYFNRNPRCFWKMLVGFVYSHPLNWTYLPEIKIAITQLQSAMVSNEALLVISKITFFYLMVWVS